jgi:hypothetical protein
MNTNKTVLSIVDKLKPAKQAVKLNVVSNLITEFEPLRESYEDAAYLAYDWGDEIMDAFSDFRLKYNLDNFIVNGQARNLKEIADTMRGYIEELETKANDLGIDPLDIYDDYENAKYFVDNADSMYSDFISKYREIISFIGIPDFS